MEWTIERSKRQCTLCQQDFQPGQEHYSAVMAQDNSFARQDFCAPCWPKIESSTFLYWKTTVPLPPAKKGENLDVVLDFYKRLLAEQNPNPEHLPLRYVLTLILIRRRRLKLTKTSRRDGMEYLTIEKSWDGESIEVVAPSLRDSQIAQLKEQLQKLFAQELTLDQNEKL